MVGRQSHIYHDRAFFWFKLLLALLIIAVFGYLFCRARACY
jgi:hypothetical protein